MFQREFTIQKKVRELLSYGETQNSTKKSLVRTQIPKIASTFSLLFKTPARRFPYFSERGIDKNKVYFANRLMDYTKFLHFARWPIPCVRSL